MRDFLRLFGQVLCFGHERRAYWMIPLFVVLVVAGFLIAAGEGVGPLLYTLF